MVVRHFGVREPFIDARVVAGGGGGVGRAALHAVGLRIDFTNGVERIEPDVRGVAGARKRRSSDLDLNGVHGAAGRQRSSSCVVRRVLYWGDAITRSTSDPGRHGEIPRRGARCCAPRILPIQAKAACSRRPRRHARRGQGVQRVRGGPSNGSIGLASITRAVRPASELPVWQGCSTGNMFSGRGSSKAVKERYSGSVDTLSQVLASAATAGQNRSARGCVGRLRNGLRAVTPPAPRASARARFGGCRTSGQRDGWGQLRRSNGFERYADLLSELCALRGGEGHPPPPR